MTDLASPGAQVRQKLVVNVGCGPALVLNRTAYFHDWRQLRVDIEPSVNPDIIADLTDLSPIQSGSADALWSSHCVEHLYLAQVPGALNEFHRVLSDDGFAVILVPDLQSVAERIVADKFDEPIYNSGMGPVTAHDMFYGFGPSIAAGHTSMAHRCGFTPTILVNLLNATKFAEYGIRRLKSLELLVVARKSRGTPGNNSEAILQALNL
jgi:SAM-dependent methyltransferase